MALVQHKATLSRAEQEEISGVLAQMGVTMTWNGMLSGRFLNLNLC